jgi:hypothetical protein
MQALLRLFRPTAKMPSEAAVKLVQDKIAANKVNMGVLIMTCSCMLLAPCGCGAHVVAS